MEHELVTVPDAAALAHRAAEYVADRARAAVARHARLRPARAGTAVSPVTPDCLDRL